MLLHIVPLQWFLTECWPLIGQLVLGSFIQNYQPHWLHTWNSRPPRCDTECHCISLGSSDFWLNAGLWLANWFPEVFSKTISPIDFILNWYSWPPGWDTDCYCISLHSSNFPPNAGLWLVDTFLAFIFATTHHITFLLEPWIKWPSDLISGPSCSSDFLLNAGLWLILAQPFSPQQLILFLS